jgi:peptidoglycan-N-acetylglucosamine deacetylase
MHGPARQILSDPTGRRSIFVTLVCFALSLVALLAGFAVAYGLFIAPELPAFGLTESKLTQLGYGRADQPAIARVFGEHRGTRVVPDVAAQTLRLAFLADSDDASFGAFQKHAAEIDGVLVDWVRIGSARAALNPMSPGETRVRSWLKANAPAAAIYPILSNRLPDRDMLQILASPDARAHMTKEIIDYVVSNNDRGVAVPLSIFPVSSRVLASRFLAELFRELRAKGRKTITVVDDPSDGARIQELARISDLVLLNCNDEARGAHVPGKAIASQDWVESRAAAISRLVPPSKLIVGLGSFARDVGPGNSRVVAVQQAWEIMAEADARLALDGSSLNARFRYFDGAGLAHEVWLLDAVSVFNHLRGVLGHSPAGVALWRLGLEDPGVWASFARGKLPDEKALSALATVSPGPALGLGGEEIVWAGTGERQGRRELAFSPQLGLIGHEALTEIPRRVKILGQGFRDEKVIALTFDDGPHEVVTPKILDILKQKGIKASFFIVGRNAAANPSVLARVREDGHDIGNHSYSHADLSTLSPREFEWELNGVQRLLEAELGIHTALFRPPFNGAAGSNMPGVAKIIETASQMGYVTVLSAVDGADWLNPPAQVIVDRVVRRIVAGRGQVILLHDWGMREATIAALPAIVDELSARGYRFVTLHELLGLTSDQVMPVIEPGSILAKTTADARSRALLTMGWLGRALPIIAIIAGVLCLARLVFVVLAVRRHMRLEASRQSDYWPESVAVIIPAYNEQAVIAKTVRSVLLAGRANYEVIVIDDGSSDATADAARKAFGDDPRVRVYKKANGGKAAAANYGLSRTNAEIVVCIDADTVLAPDAIPLLVRHFKDPSVGAVAGTAIVGNQVNFLTRLQSLEYVIGQSLDRRAFALFNANGIVPGAIGAWRKRAIVDVGSYATDTVAEDADMTFSVIRAGWKVLFEPRAEARTEAPETWRAFLKQRFRWMYGMLQVVAKHGSETWRGTSLGTMTIPNVVVFQFGYSVLIPILDILALLQVGQAVWQASHGDQMASAPTSGLATYARWWLLLQAVDLLVMAGALRLGGMTRAIRAVPLLLAQRFCYWPLIYWTALSALLAAAKGKATRWNKLNRTGRVTQDALLGAQQPDFGKESARHA